MIQRTLSLACNGYQSIVQRLQQLEGIGPLLLRLYLAPVFWMAGMHKLAAFDSTVAWFGNPDWGLGLPFPWLMAALATVTELLGAVFLLAGFATRLISIPLIITMLVAIFSVHGEYGWQAIADPSAPFANERVLASAEKLAQAKDILREHGDYEWLTSSGKLVVLNNGIEFAATYLVMLVMLLFSGGGRYLSLDYWLMRGWRRRVGAVDNSSGASRAVAL